MALAEDLLEQAQFLARREPKRPKQASLRRAVSTAYYAIFHLLIQEAVRNWRRPGERNLLSRMFEHGVMKKACAKKCKELEKTADLYFVADTFVQMQQHRHTADYDNDTKWTRVDVMNQLNSVLEAFERWKSIRGSSDAQKFLVSLLIRER